MSKAGKAMKRATSPRTAYALFAQLLALTALLVLGTVTASAAETGVVKFFGGNGTEGGQFGGSLPGVAVNEGGAGGVGAGDLYVVDESNHRIQELSSAGDFVRAFGRGVGGPGVDVCTVAASCVAGEASFAAAGLVRPGGIAVDQATGAVYVPDDYGSSSARRIDVFSATGEFEGAFGWNVKATGGAEELQFCTTASGCKAGSEGSGAGQFRTATNPSIKSVAVSPLNGHLLVADQPNSRIDEFAPQVEAGKVTGISFVRGYGWGVLDGSVEFQICTTVCHAPAPARDFNAGGSEAELGRFEGSQPAAVAVDSAGRVYALNEFKVDQSRLARIESFSAAGSPEGSFADTGIFQGAIVIDSSTGDVLTQGNGTVSVYGSSGELLHKYFEGAGAIFERGLAENGQTGTIYLTTSRPEHGVLILGEPVPPTASIAPVTTFTGTTATFEGQVDPEGFSANYQFEYSSDGVHWTALPTQELPADSAEHAVAEAATGLEAHTRYQVRLTVEKLYNSGKASAETSFETGAAAPIAAGFGARDIADTSATLRGAINPENEPTSYSFGCVTEAQFEASGYADASEAPSGGATIEASGEAVEVTQPLTGLRPDTAYRCRLVARNASGVADAEGGFATYAAQPLGPPDGRAYEQATPVDKNGGDARGQGLELKVAPDGNTAAYTIIGGGSAEGGEQHFPNYAAMRIGGTWASRGLLPGASYGSRVTTAGWSEDVRRDYVQTGDHGGPVTLYEQDLEDGAMSVIAAGLEGKAISMAAESRDGTEVVFESEEALTSDATAGWSNLYLWNRSTRKLSLLDVLSSGLPPFHGAFAGPYQWTFENPKVGGAGKGYATQQLHALSEDGSTAFFTSYNLGQLYARKGLGTSHLETVQVSASQKTNGTGAGGKDSHGPGKAAFMEATPDGRYVLFTSPEELTDDATTGTEDQGNDLYRYDTETGELIDVAPDATDPNGAEVQGVLGASADGSYVYFAANGALAEGASAGNCSSSSLSGFGGPGICGIYLWHEGEISFIASSGSRPEPDGGEAGGLNWIPGRSGLATWPRSSRVSRDGTLLFASTRSPTSYDSEGKVEFYRYEPGARLQCVSCNPTGAPPVADAQLMGITRGFTGPNGAGPPWLRNLAADGKRFFFETSDQLVADDHNEAQDVYEWEAQGTGSCGDDGQDGGCLFLVSTGKSPDPSYFGGAGESGDDVFIFTRQQLVGQDKDRLQDLYDVRVGGGIAAQNESPPARCEGEACRGPASSAPASESAGTASFAGPGNVKSTHRKKRRHAKKHHRRHHHGRHGGKHGGHGHGGRKAGKHRAGRGGARHATKARAGR